MLIVNRDGTLSALPTLQEWKENAYQSDERFITGLVKVSTEDVNRIYAVRNLVRVLMPGLPEQSEEPGWYYTIVVQGVLKCV